jgi:hypothetical protein
MRLYIGSLSAGFAKPTEKKSPIVEYRERCREHKGSYDSRERPLTWQAEWPELIAANDPPKTSEEKQPRKEAEDGGEDRVIARQGAAAAERQADYAEISLWVGGLAAIATAWAAIEAGRAATAASKSNEIARETAKSELRAYVFISTARIAHLKREAPHAFIEIKNFGQTPAYRVNHAFKFYISLIGEPPELSFPNNVSSADLGPGQVQPAALIMSKERWAARKPLISNGAATLFVIGRITYRDAFGEDRSTSYKFKLWHDESGVRDGELICCEDGNYSQ